MTTPRSLRWADGVATHTPPPTSTTTATHGPPYKPPSLTKAEFDKLPHAARENCLSDWMAERGIKRVIKSNEHHAWPKHLGGPEEAPLSSLDEQLHRAFHSALDKELQRDLGTAYSNALPLATKAKNIEILKAVARDFDLQWKTRIYDQLRKALQSTPYADVALTVP